MSRKSSYTSDFAKVFGSSSKGGKKSSAPKESGKSKKGKKVSMDEVFTGGKKKKGKKCSKKDKAMKKELEKICRKRNISEATILRYIGISDGSKYQKFEDLLSDSARGVFELSYFNGSIRVVAVGNEGWFDIGNGVIYFPSEDDIATVESISFIMDVPNYLIDEYAESPDYDDAPEEESDAEIENNKEGETSEAGES